MKRCFTFITLCLLGMGCLYAQSVDVYQRPVQKERSRDYDVKHYRIALTFDLDNKSFQGENRITFSPLKDGFETCVLDAEELQATEVFDGNGSPLDFQLTDQHITVTLARSYDYGEELSITIKYFASDPKQGLYFDDETPDHPQMVSVASWPDRAHHWFPCYDYPHDKATHDTIITVSSTLKALSNGKLVRVEDNTQDNTKTFFWQQDLPHSTYLYTLAIGPYAVIEDSLGTLPVNSWVYEKDIENGRWIFEKTPYMIDFFNKIFDYEYPWAKYAQFITSRVGGGMENTSATGLGESVIHDRRAEQDFSWERIIAHEIAHQWWGNLITLRTWSETWMNESFGTYSDYLYTRFDKGEDEGAVDLLNKKNQYLREANTRYIRPIVFTRYDRPQDNFDSHTYPKGAAVLHMMRFVLGDTPFFKTLSHFLHKHEFQAVDTHDFLVTVKEKTGQNMDWFFDQFIYKPGHPVFDVSYIWEKNSRTISLKIVQAQETAKGIPIYTIPVVIGIVTPQQKTSEKIWITKREEVFEFSASEKPLLVRFDEGNFLLKEWSFKKDVEELLYQLEQDDVIGRMWAASELLEHRDNPLVSWGLTDRAHNDSFWAVRLAAVESLGEMKQEKMIPLFKAKGRDENSKVRTAALAILGDFGDRSLVPFLMERFEKDDSYLAQAEALRSLAKCGDESLLPFLQEASQLKSPRNVIQRAAEWAIKTIQEKSFSQTTGEIK
jgi:aminopeptidase N